MNIFFHTKSSPCAKVLIVGKIEEKLVDSYRMCFLNQKNKHRKKGLFSAVFCCVLGI